MPMFFLFIFLWLITIILIFTNPRSELTRWGSAISFVTGLGAFTRFIEDHFIAVRNLCALVNINAGQVRALIAIFYAIAHFFPPYCYLVFGYLNADSVISPEVINTTKKYVKVILLLPIVLMIRLFPLHPRFYNFTILSLWTVPYVVIAHYLVFRAFAGCRNPSYRRQKELLFFAMAPSISFGTITNYILPAFHLTDSYKYNVFMVAVLFFLFIIFIWKYGFLGVRLKFERYGIDDTMKAITTGTSLLNHTIKNEIMKINMCIENLRDYIMETDKTKDLIGFLYESTDHLMNMVSRIQEKTKEIIIIEEPANLKEVIENALVITKPLLINRNILIAREYDENTIFIVKCDKVHIQEVICNITKNSIEAINDKGTIHIKLYRLKKFVTIAIQDNGIGISRENLSHIIEPFFSTKNRYTNFGLGLSYCYNVMKKHNGEIEIQSELKQGTTVLLKFPLTHSP